MTNALIKARKLIDKSFIGREEDVPILSTSAAYGVYMAISSNLRYLIFRNIKDIESNIDLRPISLSLMY